MKSSMSCDIDVAKDGGAQQQLARRVHEHVRQPDETAVADECSQVDAVYLWHEE